MALPKVTWSIIDKTYFAKGPKGDYFVYIPLFSEKGIDGEIQTVNTPEELVAKFGKPNKFKYGNGMYYALKALTYNKFSVHVLRITPQDATYSNVVLTFANEFSTTVKEDASNTDTITVDDVSGFNVGDKIALYDAQNPYATVLYANVISIDTNNSKIQIDRNVTVPAGYVVERIPDITIQYLENVQDKNIVVPDKSVVFIATGKGAYYNNIKLRFDRVKEIEKYYVDEETFKPYLTGAFYRLTIMEQKPTTSPVQLENSYTVSFASETPSGDPVISPTSGKVLYIENVINNESYHINVKVAQDFEELVRNKAYIYGQALMDFFENNIVQLNKGSDGDMSFNNKKSLLIQAYNGTLNSAANLILEGEYPFKAYEVDYVVDYTADPDVQSAIIDFAKRRADCQVILGFPYATNAEMDKNYRINTMNVSLPFVFLYSGEYCEIYDPYTKKDIEMPNSFEAMSCHLYVDTFMDFTTPVAGIVGGSVRDPIKGLSYVPTKYDAEQLTDLQINPLIKTPNGLLFYPTQLTAYKKSSYLQRQYVVKTLNRIKKDLWPQLYELLERKATSELIEEAERKIRYYLDQLKVDKPKYAVLENYNLNIDFSEGVLTVNIELQFVDIVDRIDVNLILVKRK
jgi:hypothetical protein